MSRTVTLPKGASKAVSELRLPRTTLAVDPGNTHSAYVVIQDKTRRPLDFGKIPNDEMRTLLLESCADRFVIEMIASYGMAVGADVFETCVWIGRFIECAADDVTEWELVKRAPVKLHHCHSSKAKDGNIIQALVDRFAPGQPNRGKGTKYAPGWFHGFAADVWQAYALAVYDVDSRPRRTRAGFADMREEESWCVS